MSVFAFGRAVSDRCGPAHRFCSELHMFSIDMLTDGWRRQPESAPPTSLLRTFRRCENGADL